MSGDGGVVVFDFVAQRELNSTVCVVGCCRGGGGWPST